MPRPPRRGGARGSPVRMGARFVGALLVGALASCGRSVGVHPAPAASSGSRPLAVSDAPVAVLPAAAASTHAVASAAPKVRETGPFEIEFSPKRRVWFLAARDASKPQRLVAMLHGVCNPPAYACGLWAETATSLGFLVCPQGSGSCGEAMWNAPTWTGGHTGMDADLEASVAKVAAIYPEQIDPDGAVLAGFSMGAYAAVQIAAAHPGRWPYLVLNEANVELDANKLRTAKVRAVALLAGEKGTQVGGERATVEALKKAGFPAKLWVMKDAGHHYSNDIQALMREAIEWVTSH